MSFQAKLFVGDQEFNVLTAEYTLSRAVDAHNRPNGRIRGGIIDVTIESGNEYDLLNWIVRNETRDGRLEFARRDTAGSAQRIVSFTHAFCIYMRDLFVSDGSIPMITKITISAHTLDIENNIVQNTWAGVEAGTTGTGETSGENITATDNSVSFE